MDNNLELLTADKKLAEAISTISNGQSVLTGMEKSFLLELAKAVGERKRETQNEFLIQANVDDSAFAVKLQTTLNQKVYKDIVFKNALDSFANEIGFELWPKYGMAMDPRKERPENLVERDVIFSHGMTTMYIKVSTAERRIYVYEFGRGCYIPTSIDHIGQAR